LNLQGQGKKYYRKKGFRDKNQEKKWKENEAKIFNYLIELARNVDSGQVIKQGPKEVVLNYADLRKKFGFSPSTIQKHLKDLYEKGYLKKRKNKYVYIDDPSYGIRI